MSKNVCIVGYGAIGPIHAAALAEINEANFYAVCDIDEKRIECCLCKYDVIVYKSFTEMIKDKNIDVVHICTPHHLHFEMIKNSILSGKKVVCEKPIAITKEKFDELLILPGIENVALVFQNRLNTCIQKM